MGWNGSGTFVPAITFVPNTPATAEDQNTQDVDIAAGITNSLARDGQAPATANIPFGGNKITGMANGTAPTDGVAFGQLSLLLPAGVVLPYAGVSIPIGYLLCNGQAVSRTTFAALFGALGVAYGAGNGSTTFNVPDCTGRVIAQVDPSGTVLTSFSMQPNGNTRGAAGGTEGHVLALTELTAHGHFVGITDPGHAHTYEQAEPQATGALGSDVQGFANVNAATTTQQTGISAFAETVGGNQQHLNVQPTILMYYIIKT